MKLAVAARELLILSSAPATRYLREHQGVRNGLLTQEGICDTYQGAVMSPHGMLKRVVHTTMLDA